MPDWNKSAHSFDTALALAKASQAAYANELKPKDWAAAHGFAVEAEIESAGMFGFAASQGETLVLAFRGTNERSDWLVNLNSDRHRVNGLPGEVHDGFWRQGLQPLWPGLQSALNAKTYRRIWITGHSLGGAIAVLCQAALIFQQNRMVTGLYTFGQPRVGDTAFRDELDEHTSGQYHRYVNHNDIVPLVPPHSLGFRHGGGPLRFDRDGNPQNRDGIFARLAGVLDLVEDQFDSILNVRPKETIASAIDRAKSVPGQGVREHGIGEYIRHIQRALTT